MTLDFEKHKLKMLLKHINHKSQDNKIIRT